MTNHKNKVSEKLDKLKKSATLTKNKYQEIRKELSEKYLDSDPPINVTIVRNLNYTQNVIKKINENINHIESISKNDKITKSEQKDIDEKFVTSFALLESLSQIQSENNIYESDYEILNLKIIQNPSSNISKKEKYQKLFDIYNDKIVETFDSVKVRVVEGFDMGPLLDVIDTIVDGFMVIVDGLIEIAKFVGELLMDFIMLLFELLKWLYNFIIDYLPKMITAFYYFMDGFFTRLYKVGIIMPFVFVSIYLFLIKWLDKVFGVEPQVAVTFSLTFSVFISIWLFWYETDSIEKFMNSCVKLIADFALKFSEVFGFILGVDQDHRIFDKDISLDKRRELVLDRLLVDFPLIIFRFAIVTVIMQYVIEFLIANLSYPFISLKQLSQFPIVLSKDIIKLGVTNFT